MAGQEAVERAVPKRQRESITDHELGFWDPLSRDLEHARAGIEADDVAAQVLGQPSGPAGDVECPGRRQFGDRAFESPPLFVPAWPVAAHEKPGTVDPVVVLPGPPLVVRPHAPRVRAWRCPSNRSRTSPRAGTGRQS